MYKLIIFCFLCINCISSSQMMNVLGNVYTYQGRCNHWSDIYINSFRIEEISKNSLYVRFQIGKEIFYPIEMKREKERVFVSKSNIPIYVKNESYSTSLKMEFFKNENKVVLVYKNVNGQYLHLSYLKTRKDFRNLDKSRNSYHAEDGFQLCP